MKVAVADVCGSNGCLSQTSDAFQRKLVSVARAIGVQPSELAAVIAFETGGSFAADQLNEWCRRSKGDDPNECGTGLIQFMPPTTRTMASRLGIALDNRALARMSSVRQLDFVQYYFRGFNRGTYAGLGDLYRTVFWPAARGKPDSFVAARSGTAAYTQNRGLDSGGKGYITAADIDAPVRSILASAARRPPVVVEMNPFPVFPVILGLGVGAAAAYASVRYADRLPRFGQKLTWS